MSRSAFAFSLQNRIAIASALDFCPFAERLAEGPRVNDFLRCLPLPRKLEQKLALIGNHRSHSLAHILVFERYSFTVAGHRAIWL